MHVVEMAKTVQTLIETPVQINNSGGFTHISKLIKVNLRYTSNFLSESCRLSVFWAVEAVYRISV
jgi:hypothetical protein